MFDPARTHCPTSEQKAAQDETERQSDSDSDVKSSPLPTLDRDDPSRDMTPRPVEQEDVSGIARAVTQAPAQSDKQPPSQAGEPQD